MNLSMRGPFTTDREAGYASRLEVGMRAWMLVGLLLAGCAGGESKPAEVPPVPVPTPEAAAPETKPAEPAPAAVPEIPAGARVFFVSPADGATVKSPVHVVFGVEKLTVQPAGEVVAGTGHHHLIIDGEATPKGTIVAADATHLHFGKGQTETDVELTPGDHALTLQFADGNHQSYGAELSSTIHVKVE
jgi:hypothetical protein